jgi:hypothetical protein
MVILVIMFHIIALLATRKHLDDLFQTCITKLVFILVSKFQEQTHKLCLVYGSIRWVLVLEFLVETSFGSRDISLEELRRISTYVFHLLHNYFKVKSARDVKSISQQKL